MFKFSKSVIKSIGRGIANDPEVQKLAGRFPRTFGFIRKRFTADEKFGLHLTLGIIFTFIFVFFFFGILQDYIGRESLVQADIRIISLVQIFRTPFFNNAMLLITYIGRWEVVFLGVAIISAFLIYLKRRRYLIALLVSVGFGEIFVWVVKNLIERPRPPLVNALAPETSFSFPSGHSFVAISFYGFLAYLLVRSTKRKFLKILAVFTAVSLIFTIGFSRIYLGAHWPSDVLASYAAGAAWLTVIITAVEIRGKFKRAQNNFIEYNKLKLTAVALILFLFWVSYIVIFYRTHPLKILVKVSEVQQTITLSDIPQNLFSDLPHSSEDITGQPMEPVHIIIVGSKRKLEEVFKQSHWFTMDPINPFTIKRLVLASIFNDSYPEAPGVPSFWNTRTNDFAFEQPAANNSARERHHIHFWQTPFILADERRVWFGTAHFDQEIKMGASVFFFPTHMIDPAIDKERDKVKEDLFKTGLVDKVIDFQIVEPKLGENQSGDLFFTDGKAYVIFLK